MDSYILNVATQIIIQAIAAYGLNVIVGNAGQISLGHAAFVGIGAYSAAMLTTALTPATRAAIRRASTMLWLNRHSAIITTTEITTGFVKIIMFPPVYSILLISVSVGKDNIP